MVRPGFGLAEAIVALVVFAVGALGAAALSAHAARMTARSERREAAVLRMEELLDSLGQAPNPVDGASRERAARYEWSVQADSIGRRVVVRAWLGADTLLLDTRYRAAPAVLEP